VSERVRAAVWIGRSGAAVRDEGASFFLLLLFFFCERVESSERGG